ACTTRWTDVPRHHALFPIRVSEGRGTAHRGASAWFRAARRSIAGFGPVFPGAYSWGTGTNIRGALIASRRAGNDAAKQRKEYVSEDSELDWMDLSGSRRSRAGDAMGQRRRKGVAGTSIARSGNQFGYQPGIRPYLER